MTSYAIQASHLRRDYGAHTALADLTLDVPYGDIFGLLGHNGAGKTTTVSLLTTLLEPTSGSARVAGFDISTNAGAVRNSIGYLPENVQFYDDLSLRENLRFFGQLSGIRRPDERIDEVLALIEFEGHTNERLGTFSKGMRQRVGIAQAILHRPKILFLDEPTSGLDPEGVRGLRDVIIRLNRELGITVFMNTHLLSEVSRTCTSIGILRQGKLVHHDTLANTLGAFPTEEDVERTYFEAGMVDAS